MTDHAPLSEYPSLAVADGFTTATGCNVNLHPGQPHMVERHGAGWMLHLRVPGPNQTLGQHAEVYLDMDSLEELHEQAGKIIEHEKKKAVEANPCPKCHGKGWHTWLEFGSHDCSLCDGSGVDPTAKV